MANRIDCSITENYLKEKARALQPSGEEYCTIKCKGCPFENRTVKNEKYPHIICVSYELLYPNDAISRIQAWSDAHPRKTYKDNFFEKFPDTPTHSFDYPDYSNAVYPNVKPCEIYNSTSFNCQSGRPCEYCWDLLMEGV